MKLHISIMLALSLALTACPDTDDNQPDTVVTPDADVTTTPDDGGATPDDGGANPDDGGTTDDGTTGDEGIGPDDGTTGDEGVGPDDGGPTDDGGTDDGEVITPLPTPPALGSLIDRMGRAGISTALIGEFGGTDGDDDDAYQATEPSDWQTTWIAEIAANLAIYDSLDGTCGNQLLAGPAGESDSYFPLANVLVDDRLYVDSSTSTCGAYLGVELGLPDCGGRKPSYDVIDGTYTVLANGGAAVISDGVDGDDGSVDETTFPFLDMGGSAFPAPPALGSLIDRMGRAGVSTALIGEFGGQDSVDDDAYQVDELSEWQTEWTDHIAGNLAIYDSLDGTCGNQLLAGPAGQADSYFPLATVLVDDRLYVNSASSTCTAYLGVELGADDCGGRKPGYDVIDATYSVLAIGAPTGISDGVDTDDGTVDDTTFPFLDEAGLGFPNPPALGSLIDRMGRAGVSTALVGEFTGDDGGSDDAYQVAEVDTWGTFAAEIQAQLAIYDSLDGTCGNQLLAAAGAATSETHAALAGVLADDRLYLNAAQTTCSAYFAVELGADDCGGRTPSYDVIDATYSVLAIGAASGISDGVDGDDGSVDEAVFPFLDAIGPPPPPALGSLIDRMGRAGVSTALIGEFTGDDATSDDDYQIAEVDTWATFTAEIQTQLAIYDSLDGNCGNQLLAAAPPASASTYAGLAGVLADDRLYLNASETTCSAYLGVELGAADCGGRMPGYDVIDATYSVLAIGAATGIADGVPADDDPVDPGSFPFLNVPGT